MKNDLTKIQLTLVYECDLDQALENVKQALPTLNFVHPEINMMHTECGWRVELQEDKEHAVEQRRVSA